MEDGAVKLMEEMNRFEAEIATDVPPDLMRPIIGSNTFNAMQQKLDNSNVRPKFGVPGGNVNSAPLVPLKFNPPPPPPAANLFSNVFPAIPPPPPPPSFLIPSQVRGARLVESQPVVGMLQGLAAAQPAVIGSGPTVTPRPRPGPVVLSAAPTKYKSPPKKSKLDDELNEFFNEIKKEEEQAQMPHKSTGKMMADQVRANTVVSIQPVSGDYNYLDPSSSHGKKKDKKNRKLIRMAGGQTWEDSSLQEWEDGDFRIFCGDLGNDVTDEVLIRAFNKYSSFLKAKVVRDKRTNKTKGFGFVSFKDPQDFIRAMKEMNGRYVGSRPIKLRKSCWRQRSLDVVKKKEKEKATLINILTGR